MSTFKLEKELPSCEVTKDLIKHLEEYLIDQVAQIARIEDRDKLEKNFHIAISDNFGIEQLSSINEYAFPFFSDSTTQIILTSAYYSVPERLSLSINFDRNRHYANITIETSARNAREVSMGLYDGLLRIIDPHKNNNYFFHPVDDITLLIIPLLLIPLLIGVGITFFWRYEEAVLFANASLLLIIIYLIIGIKGKPYISFDSRFVQSSKRFWSFLWYGALGFIIFGTVLVLFRKKLLGF